MTASAGDNLVKRRFEHFETKPKLLVQRLTPREMLQSSKLLSEYMGTCYSTKTSVGSPNAKEEPRTAMTKPIRVLKMLGMGSDEKT
jgi:hypothetical protein